MPLLPRFWQVAINVETYKQQIDASELVGLLCKECKECSAHCPCWFAWCLYKQAVRVELHGAPSI